MFFECSLSDFEAAKRALNWHESFFIEKMPRSITVLNKITQNK